MSFIALTSKNYDVGKNFRLYGGNVTLSGLIIVFSMLVLLVFVIAAFGAIMSSGKKKSKPEKASAPAPVKVQPVADDSDDDGDTIAAISAAVMMMYEGTGITPVIRSVRPAKKSASHSAWRAAGVVQNTQPF